MAPKRTRKAVGVATNLYENNNTPVRPPTTQSKSRLPTSSISHILNQDIIESDGEADGCDRENQEYLNNDHLHKMSSRSSTVWEHMTKYDDDKAKCTLCEAVLSRKNYGTTGLRKHLHQVHKLERFSISSATRRSSIKKVSVDMKKNSTHW